uniref:MotA/TolQ/ExbB proton channel family protein n=1 Tax=candidate division WOR-3 bacterium TaxID=2052148 RepID=A0A7C6A969_UNCW3
MILGQPLIQIFKNSIVMLLLLGCSIACLALIIERLWFFTKNRFNVPKAFQKIRSVYRNPGTNQALEYARAEKNPLGRVFTLILENIHLSLDEIQDISYSQILDEKMRAERFLSGLGTLANVATLLGLLGTVTGLIRAFHNIALTGSGGPVVVSAGIAEALITTAFGLLIGIPALLFYNYFTKKANDMALTLESAAEKLMIFLERTKRGQKEPKIREHKPKPFATGKEAKESQSTPAEITEKETNWRY